MCAVGVILAAGCVEELRNESAALGELIGDCVVAPPPGVNRLPAPISVDHGGRSLWIFESLEAPFEIRNAAAYVDSVGTACAGTIELLTDDAGAPVSLIGLTPAEVQRNGERNDGRREIVAARGGFEHDGRAYIYYDKLVAGPGSFDAELVGTGLCILADRECVRARPEVYADEPTLLWTRGERTFNRAGLVAGDGYAYLYGCFHAAAFTDLCAVARVRPDQAAEPAAYQYRGFDDWIDDPWDAVVLFESSGPISVISSDFLGSTVAITTDSFASTLGVSAADQPDGDFSKRRPIIDAIPSPSFFIGGGSVHPELGSADGRVIAATYSTDGEPGGLHLVTYRFNGVLP